MKKILPLLSLLLLPVLADARIMKSWSYQEMTEKADAIVIATPVSVTDTAERTTLPPNVPGGIPVIGVETTFEILSVLKGDEKTTKVVLHHLRDAEKSALRANGPGLVAFEPKEKKRFLLFLKREPDGRYAPLVGQMDPYQCVRDLGNHP
jgi:hypothetical protein